MRIIETKGGTVIEVFVKPSQPRFNVKIDDGEIAVFCTEEPVKGKVNKELLKELSRLFNARVEIVSGVASRQKRLLIANTEKSVVEQILCVL
ncbi:MAG: DUF167 family protein [Candidatus Bathyarchaeota archaeon]|nr:DUF167 family protein [Candidatus Bathyarchaeota archaeon]